MDMDIAQVAERDHNVKQKRKTLYFVLPLAIQGLLTIAHLA